MTYTLATIDLGTIQDENHRQYSNLDYQSFPLSTSAQAMIFDYDGVKRVITVSGTYADTEANVMDNFIVPIEALQNGNQFSTITYHSNLYDLGTDKDGNFNVKINSFVWKWAKGVPGKIEYTIVLFEGT